MRKVLIGVLAIITSYAISWAVVVSFIKLITICFSVNFQLKIATGIWLILCALKFVFHNSERSK